MASERNPFLELIERKPGWVRGPNDILAETLPHEMAKVLRDFLATVPNGDFHRVRWSVDFTDQGELKVCGFYIGPHTGDPWNP